MRLPLAIPAKKLTHQEITLRHLFGKDGIMARGLIKIGEDYQYYDEMVFKPKVSS